MKMADVSIHADPTRLTLLERGANELGDIAGANISAEDVLSIVVSGAGAVTGRGVPCLLRSLAGPHSSRCVTHVRAVFVDG